MRGAAYLCVGIGGALLTLARGVQEHREHGAAVVKARHRRLRTKSKDSQVTASSDGGDAASWLRKELRGVQVSSRVSSETSTPLLGLLDASVPKRQERAAAASDPTEEVDKINSMLIRIEEGHDIESIRCWDRAQVLHRQINRTLERLAAEEERMASLTSSMECSSIDQEHALLDLGTLRRRVQDHASDCGHSLLELRERAHEIQADADAVGHEAESISLLGGGGEAGLALLVRCVGHRRGPLALALHPKRHRKVRSLLQDPAVQQEIRHSLAQVRLSRAGGCMLERSVNLQEGEAAMIVSHAELEDELWEAKRERVEVEARCRRVSASLQGQEKSLTLRHAQLQGQAALAASQRAALQEGLLLKRQELAQLREEASQLQVECSRALHGYHEDGCNLRRVRAELLETSGSSEEVQDCQVEAWVPEQCSASCGGGVQKLTRKVSLEANTYGAPCPPLTTEEPCNTQPCPSDCQVSEWGEWSQCTALCGGGTRSRSRVVKVEAKDGGAPCPHQNMVTEACATDACEVDCVLGDWTPWTQCTRACGGGVLQRVQQVVKPAIGAGFCPDEDQRREYGKCNAQECPVSSDESFKCSSKLDIVLVLDGGGEADGEDGFEESKNFTKSFLEKVQLGSDKARVAVVVAGAPTSWSAYKKCLNGTAATLDDCGAIVKGSLQSDGDSVSSAVDGLEHPQGPGNVGGALSLAATELFRVGRRDARWVVLVVSRSRPLSAWKTGEEAAKLRQQARVIWISATADAASEREAAAWATQPSHDNVLQTNGGLPDLMHDAVTVVCPVLGSSTEESTLANASNSSEAIWSPDNATKQAQGNMGATPVLETRDDVKYWAPAPPELGDDPACNDSPSNWVSSTGQTCESYEHGEYCTSSGGFGMNWDTMSFGTFEDYATQGVSADEACCACGGGVKV